MTEINRRKFLGGGLATGGVVMSRIVLPVPLTAQTKTRVDSDVEGAAGRAGAPGGAGGASLGWSCSRIASQSRLRQGFNMRQR